MGLIRRGFGTLYGSTLLLLKLFAEQEIITIVDMIVSPSIGASAAGIEGQVIHDYVL